MSLKSNLLKNGIATGFQKLVRVLEQLFLVPFFISSWGAAYYGEWITLTIIPSVLAFADLGFGSAVANGFVLKYVSGDKNGAFDLKKAGFFIISVMVGLGSIISVVVLLALDYYSVFNESLIKANDAIVAVSLMILARLVSFYNQLFEAYYRAERKAALSINLLTVSSFLSMIVGMIILLMKGGVVFFALSQLVVMLFFTLFFGWLGERTLVNEEGYKGRIRKDYLKEITIKGLGYLMSPVWQAIYFQGTTFIVRVTIGAEGVAIFNTARTLSRSVNQLFSLVNGTVFPELQYELGLGNLSKAQKLFQVSVQSVFILGLGGAFVLWLAGSWFYGVWTHNQLIVPDAVWIVFIIGILFNAVWWTAGMIFRAVNKPYQFAIVGLVASLLTVVSSYFFATSYGLVGAAVGSLLFDVIMAIYVLPVSCKLMDMSLIEIVDFKALRFYLKKKKVIF